VSILAVSRAGRTTFDPEASYTLYPGDRVVLLGERENLESAVALITQREFGSQDGDDTFTIAAVDVPSACGLGGKTLGELHFRRDFGVTVIGIERGDQRLRTMTASTAIESEDRLIVAGCGHAVASMQAAIIDACRID